MPVPMMLAITIEHAVTKPIVRLGGADVTAAGWVSVIICREVYSTFLLQNAEHPKFNGEDRTKGNESIPFSVHHILPEHFRQLSAALPGITLQQHERISQALRRNGHAAGCFPC
jgi:hypothetical protein